LVPAFPLKLVAVLAGFRALESLLNTRLGSGSNHHRRR
jgi:hypothetical protein